MEDKKRAGKTMWAVSSGEYSDYRVLCLCETKDDAEAVARKLAEEEHSWRADARVESFVVVDADVEKVKTVSLSVELWDNGQESKDRQNSDESWPWEDDFAACSWRWIRAPMYDGQGGRLYVTGTDVELCRKVFSEKRAALKADAVLAQKRELKGRVP